MRNLTNIILCATCLAIATPGCHESRARPQALTRAKTAAAEAQAFIELKHSAGVLGFVPYDADGNKLKGRDEPWDQVERIVLRVDGQTIEHRLIDRSNLQILLGP